MQKQKLLLVAPYHKPRSLKAIFGILRSVKPGTKIAFEITQSSIDFLNKAKGLPAENLSGFLELLKRESPQLYFANAIIDFARKKKLKIIPIESRRAMDKLTQLEKLQNGIIESLKFEIKKAELSGRLDREAVKSYLDRCKGIDLHLRQITFPLREKIFIDKIKAAKPEIVIIGPAHVKALQNAFDCKLLLYHPIPKEFKQRVAMARKIYEKTKERKKLVRSLHRRVETMRK